MAKRQNYAYTRPLNPSKVCGLLIQCNDNKILFCSIKVSDPPFASTCKWEGAGQRQKDTQTHTDEYCKS